MLERSYTRDSVGNTDADNRDGFHNITIERDEYVEPENALLKKCRDVFSRCSEKCVSDQPEGYYYDPDFHDGLAMHFLDFTSFSRRLSEDENFNYFIIFIIILAGINVGIQTYPQLEHNAVLDIIDFIILLVFSVEVIVKVFAEGLAPQMYFFGKEWKWNTFDFSIVFLSLPVWGGLFGGGSLALLRLVRLMRLAKLIKKIPALQMIVRGLTGGLSSIAYILLLLILVFYLFAVTGFYLFGANDPFHFGTLPISMITMFRCATLDAWSDIMYLNIFGCDSYPYLYVVDEEEFTDENRLFWCEKPKAQYILSACYFVFFIVMSALVMLSLFIGAVTLSMNDSLVELKTLALEKKKKERYEKNMTKMFLANSKIEKRKRLSDNSNSLRQKFMSSVTSKIKKTDKKELERFKLEMQLDPKLVAMHRAQAAQGVQTRSAILNHKKGAIRKENKLNPTPLTTPVTSPPGTPVHDLLKSSQNVSHDNLLAKEESFIVDEIQQYSSDDDAIDDDSSSCCQMNSITDVDGDAATGSLDGPMLEKSLSMQEKLETEHANEVALKEIEAMEKRNRVLTMIAEKNESSEQNPRHFSLMIPNALKHRFDQSVAVRNEQHALEVGRLLRVAMGEQAHGEEEDPKSFSSFVSRMKRAVGFYAKFKIFSEYCKFVSEHQWFVGMVTCVIVLAGVNVGAQTESRLMDVYVINRTVAVLDIFILTVFTIEVVLKILAEGDQPFRYFYDGWNRFDFIIVVGSYVPGAGSLLTILRLLRLLRVLKLVKSLPQLAVIVNALMMGLSSIGYIGLILFMCFYVFAIAGMMLFRNNDPFHFGNLHISMFTLFRCSTLDDWTEILYVNMYGCDNYPGVYEDFPEMCDSPKKQGILSCIYFFAFIVIGAQVLLTLFIGVVTTSMEQAKEIQLNEQKMDKQLNTIEKSLGLSEIQMNCFRKAFNLLDLDGGGTIEEDEVAMGLQSIHNLMDGTSIEEEVKKSDPLKVGIDLMQFIVVVANIPRCKHRRLIKRTLKKWRMNKQREGFFYVRSSRKLTKNTPKKEAEESYLEERPITHSHYTRFRIEKDKLHALLFSYFQHHKLAFQFFQKNEYSTKLDQLTFLRSNLKRRHSCSNLPESQYEQYLAFGKEFDISETQQFEHSNTIGRSISNGPLPANSLKMLNMTRRRRQTQFTSLGNITDSSKNFFKTFMKSSSNVSFSDEDNNKSSRALNVHASPDASQRTGGDVTPPGLREHSLKKVVKGKSSSLFTFGRKISPRVDDDVNDK